jgi:hypothetical protein
LLINLGRAEEERFQLSDPAFGGRVLKSPGASLRFIKKLLGKVKRGLAPFGIGLSLLSQLVMLSLALLSQKTPVKAQEFQGFFDLPVTAPDSNPFDRSPNLLHGTAPPLTTSRCISVSLYLG